MKYYRMAGIFTGLALFLPGVSGAAPATASAVTDDFSDVTKFRFNSNGGKCETVVPDGGNDITSALRITVSRNAKNVWGTAIRSATGIPLAWDAGHVFEVRFLARCLKPLPGRDYASLTVMVELPTPPNDKLFSGGVRIWGKQWRRYRVVTWKPAGKRSRVFAPGELNFVFHLGYGIQTLEIGGIELIDHGVTDYRKIRDREPGNSADYRGREASASWRQQAEERIETLRKGDFQLRLLDEEGNVLGGVPVQLNLKRHAFLFGSCVPARTIRENPRFAREFVRLFNCGTPEYEMKWCWRHSWSWNEELQFLEKFFADHRIVFRGHCTVWPSWERTPHWLRRLEKQPTALREVVRDHIAYQLFTVRGKMPELDLVNEVLYHNAVLKIAGGESELAEWFRLAHRVAPEMRLYLNDTGILTAADAPDNPTAAAYRRVIDGLKKAGAPLGGIGFQCHASMAKFAAPENVLRELDRFAVYGVPLKITEYDFRTTDEALAADYLRDMLYVAFSHPAMTGFLMWGFWDGNHWCGSAPIFDKDWNLKPSGRVFEDLVHRKWRTALEGKTSETGCFTGRGFYGTYRLRAETAAGRSLIYEFTLEPEKREYVLRPQNGAGRGGRK